MILDKCFTFHVRGIGRKAQLLNRFKLFYWRGLLRKDVIGFFMGIPIFRSQNLIEDKEA